MALSCRVDGSTFLFTSESVGEGHPDKICDQVSDAVLDAHLMADPNCQVSVECTAKTGMLLLLGNIRSNAHVDYQHVVRSTIQHIGYDDSSKGFDYKTCNVLHCIEEHEHLDNNDLQANDFINSHNFCSDQGIVFGYATDETDECMPLTITLSHQLNAKMAELRRNGSLPWARPDSKTQVTVEYRMEGGACIPIRIHTIVISVQHSEDVTLDELRSDLMEKVVRVVIPSRYLDDDTVYHLQPSGRFIIGGPQSDAGLTGRKVIVDTYGGWGAHGGGAFSGKCFYKVARSSAYAARWIAKSLVVAGLCRRVLVQLSYVTNTAEPSAIFITSYGTSSCSDRELANIVRKNFDLSIDRIIEDLNLRQPIYQKTAVYGHFGRPEFSWEKPKILSI